MARLIREVVEEIAFQARKSEFVDQASGVSARVPIAAMECLLSNVEKRAMLQGSKKAMPRMCDLYAAVPALTGKIELVYEGEQEGVLAVAKRIIGQAVQAAFQRTFPDAYQNRPRRGKSRAPRPTEGSQDPPEEDSPYKPMLDWFAKGNSVEITDRMTDREYAAALDSVEGLAETAATYLKDLAKNERPLAMEFLLEGLHQISLIAREDLDSGVSYRDMLKQMFESMEGSPS